MVQPTQSVELPQTMETTWTPTPVMISTHTVRPEMTQPAAFSSSATADPFSGISSSIERVVVESGGDWYILIKSTGGDVIYARGEGERIHPASVIKVPIAMLFFAALEQEEQIEDLGGYLKTHGTDGRSYDQLLRAMLVKSEEPAAEILLAWTRQKLRVDTLMSNWGVQDTRLEPRRTSLEDLSRFYQALYEGEWISANARAYILALMAEYTPNDELRLGHLRDCQEQGEQFFNKRGTLTDGLLIVGDTAIFERAGSTYFIGVFAFQNSPSEAQTTYERLEAGMADFSEVVCNYFGDLR